MNLRSFLLVLLTLSAANPASSTQGLCPAIDEQVPRKSATFSRAAPEVAEDGGFNDGFHFDGELLAVGDWNYGWVGVLVVFPVSEDGQVGPERLVKPPDWDRSGSFGSAVTTSPEWLFVGDPLYDLGTGAVYAYRRHPSGELELQGEVFREDRRKNDHFGDSLAVSGNLLVIGSIGYSITDGAIWVAHPEGSGWKGGAPITHPFGTRGEYFGERVAISPDLVAVTARPWLFLFRRSGGTLSLEGAAAAPQRPVLPGLAVHGEAVLLGNAGYVDPETRIFGGGAGVYRKGQGEWGGEWVREAMLLAADASDSAYVGAAVALERDVAVLSAPGDGESGGAVYVFRRDAGHCWTETAKGRPPERANEFGSEIGWARGWVAITGNYPDPIWTFPFSIPDLPLEAAPAHRRLLPAAAHADGAGGEWWRSDLVLANPGSVEARVQIFLLTPSGLAGSWELHVGAGATERLDDVVARKLGGIGVSGAVLVASDRPLLAQSRTYHDLLEGDYGQGVPVVPESAWFSNGTAILPRVEETDRRRTNFGAANAGESALALRVELVGSDGSLLGSTDVDVPARGSVQVNRIARRITAGAVDGAWLRVSGSGGAWFPWASIVETGSGDALFVEPAAPSDWPVYIPAVAHAPGHRNATWRSDLVLVNPGSVDSVVSIRRYGPGGVPPRDESMTVAAGTTLTIPDVLAALFGEEGAAGLRVTPASGSVVAWSRTWNELPEGSFGQAIPAVAPLACSSAAVAGAVGHRWSTYGYGSRTNVGFVNPGDRAAEVRIEVLSGEGALLGASIGTVPPEGYFQLGRVADAYLPSYADDLFLRLSGTEGLVAWASTIDNHSGDPHFVLPEPFGCAD